MAVAQRKEQGHDGAYYEAEHLARTKLAIFVVSLNFGQNMNGAYIKECTSAEEHAKTR